MENKKNILLADDNEALHHIIKMIFQDDSESVAIDSVYDGKAAWEKIQKQHYDLLITDVQMPGLDGLALIDRINRIKLNIPIIVISGLALNNPNLKYLGVKEIYEKPLDPYEFRKTVLGVLGLVAS